MDIEDSPDLFQPQITQIVADPKPLRPVSRSTRCSAAVLLHLRPLRHLRFNSDLFQPQGSRTGWLRILISAISMSDHRIVASAIAGQIPTQRSRRTQM
jgi:hypothetical protein